MYDDRGVRWVQCEKCCKTFHVSCVNITNIENDILSKKSVIICEMETYGYGNDYINNTLKSLKKKIACSRLKRSCIHITQKC